MATVNVYMKWDYTGNDDSYSSGSTTTAKTITTGNNVYDRTFVVTGGTLTTLWEDSISGIGDFDFLFIESNAADSYIQLVCNEGGTLSGNNIENGFCFKLDANKPFILFNDDSKNMGNMNGTFNESNYQSEIDTWETNWANDTIDRIEFHNSGNATVRIFAVT
jgi:hypothetical protein